MDPIIDFLAEDRALENVKEAARVRRTATQYWLFADQKLYRRSFEGPYLQYLRPNQAEELLTELHKAGLDIVGPFPRATGNRRFVLVAVDYFTKWAEAEELANIRDVDVKRFFDSKAFQEFCNNLGIRNRYSTLAYLQSNGQAEVTNKAIVNGLKKRLEGAKGRWAEEFLSVLWAYRTTPRRSTGETLFSLTYGAEVVILAEVNLCSARVARFTLDENEKLMSKQLNLLEEHREVATIRLAEY
ncbi:uncharacterized protein LOC142632934 [Castanea sativa]|uniref:uncharacterized protein LOC142632934 n=1 Tax=Castanea sativa TaxID=21020 RepID=UPI003F652E52